MKAIRMIGLIGSIAVLAACKKWDDYKKFQEGGEIIYPRKGDVVVKPGRNRILIAWSIKGDKNLAKYKLYWNNKSDSIVADIPDGTQDTVFIFHNNLREQTYNYQLFSVDRQGRKSIPNMFSTRAYGEVYQSGLVNRSVKSATIVGAKLAIVWNAADTIHTKTLLSYTGINDLPKTLVIRASDISNVLEDWKPNTRLYINSSYKPTSNSIDEFTVAYSDVIF